MPETLSYLFPYTFYGTIICVAVLEVLIPNRRNAGPVGRRWTTNIGLFLTAFAIRRLLVPVSLIAVAALVAQSGYGVLQYLGGPIWLTVPLGVLVIDLWKYFEHRLLHGVPVLWRLHLVHHSDVEVDFTTAERHHPLEVVMSIGSSLAVIGLFGIPPLAVMIHILIISACALVSHANIRVDRRLDFWLRLVLVTPGFHVVHHSTVGAETDSNFGGLLTWWDRIFGTCRSSSPADDAARVIGLEYFRDARSARFDQVLWQPFLSDEARRERPVTP